MTECRRLRYPNRAYSMRTVNHAAGHALLVQIVCFFFRGLRSFGHMLEVQEAAEGIGVSLTLHHLKSLLVLIAFAVHWACPYHHLVCLVVLLALEVVLVLQLLVVLVLLVVHHHLHLIRWMVLWIMHVRGILTAVHLCRPPFLIGVLVLILAEHQMRFDGEVLFLFWRQKRPRGETGGIEWVHMSTRLNIKVLLVMVLLHR